MYSLPSASQMREPYAANDERRIAADGAKCTHRRVHAAGDQLLGTLLQLAGLLIGATHRFLLRTRRPGQSTIAALQNKGTPSCQSQRPVIPTSARLSSRYSLELHSFPQYFETAHYCVPSTCPSNREGLLGRPWGAPGCPLFCFVMAPDSENQSRLSSTKHLPRPISSGITFYYPA